MTAGTNKGKNGQKQRQQQILRFAKDDKAKTRARTKAKANAGVFPLRHAMRLHGSGRDDVSM
jgi:hypothetical protein